MSLAITTETSPALAWGGGIFELPAGVYRIVDVDGAGPGLVYFITDPGGRLAGLDRDYVTVVDAVLTDYPTGQPIGPATVAQWLHAAGHGHRDTGAFTVDRDGDPCPNDADPAVFGPLRTVFISGGGRGARHQTKRGERMSIWAIAEVTDSTPDNLEYGVYRGFVLLCDDVAEKQVDSLADGLVAYAERTGLTAADEVVVSVFNHDQYQSYWTLKPAQTGYVVELFRGEAPGSVGTALEDWDGQLHQDTLDWLARWGWSSDNPHLWVNIRTLPAEAHAPDNTPYVWREVQLS